MANGEKDQRHVSLTITVRINDVTQEEAQDIENRIRDVADDYGQSDVSAMRGAPRPKIG